MNETIDRQERKTLKATYEVKPDHVPNWLRLQIIRTIHVPRDNLDGWGALQYALRDEGWGDWVDHWGSAAIDGQTAFVSEPYADADNPPAGALNFAKRFGLRLEVRRASAWNPPSTIGLLFFPPTMFAPLRQASTIQTPAPA